MLSMSENQVIMMNSSSDISVKAKITENVSSVMDHSNWTDVNSILDVDLLIKLSTVKYKYAYIIAGLGILANMLALVVLLQPPMRRRSTYAYLAVLAVSDSMVLAGSITDILIGEEILLPNQTVVLISDTLRMYCRQCSAWLLVAVTVDRYIAVAHPLRARRTCKRTTAYMVILSLFVILSPLAIAFIVINLYKQYHQIYIFYNVNAAIYAVIPFISLLVLNGLIIYRMRQRSNLRQEMVDRSKITTLQLRKRLAIQSQVKSEEERLTIILLSTTFAYSLLIFPKIVYLIIRYGDRVCFTEACSTAVFVTHFLGIINHSINICLYCLTGSIFRGQLLSVVSCCRSRVTPASPMVVSKTGSQQSETRFQFHVPKYS